jgi:hypothetical protein
MATVTTRATGRGTASRQAGTVTVASRSKYSLAHI